jgi:hypothetical protein
MSRAFAIAALAALVLLRAWSAPPWPDDWDGVGFALSIRSFDMDHFAPHAPGYPVYVAMLRIAALVVRDPVDAANAVAVTSGAVAVALAWAAARRAIDPSRAWWVAVAVAITPRVWRSSTAIGSEAPALAFAALVAYGLTRTGWPAAIAIGAGIGLGLGVRLSWAPLFAGMFLLAPRAVRLRAIGVAAVLALAWIAPLVAIVGPRHLVPLLQTHGEGHMTRWGGTALSDPGLARIAFLARDLVIDGLGAGSDNLGLAVGVVGLGLAKLGFDAWKEADFAHTKLVATALGPYLVWITIAQNLRQQPRHALPLVVALAVILALAATSATRARTVGVIFFFIVGVRTLSDAAVRHDTPPAGAQLVEKVRALPDPSRVAVFGGPSARMFELTDLHDQAFTVGTIGDATMALGRMRSLPTRVLVTSEVEGRASVRTTPFATLCRPERLDRRAPCLTVYEWSVGR